MEIKRFHSEMGEEQLKWLHIWSIRSLDRCYSREQMDAMAPLDSRLEDWAAYTREISVFVAEENGRIVGFGDIIHNGAGNTGNTGCIKRLYIDSSHFRRGYGSKLLEALEAEAKRMGIARVELESNLPARKFYENHGYKAAAKKQKLFGDIAVDVFEMVKVLDG